MNSIRPPKAPPRPDVMPFLSVGFRPFFLVAGGYAVLVVLAWFAVLDSVRSLPVAGDPVLWHGHEMIYGFGAAVIAGFFLTITANWTGRGPFRGAGLAGLVALWALGRVAYWASGTLPAWLVGIVDLSFLPCLVAIAMAPVIASGNRRQLVFVFIFAVLWLGNLWIFLDWSGIAAVDGRWGLRLGLYAAAMLITVMGGRIIPSFASSYLKRSGKADTVRFDDRLDRVVILSTLAVLVIDLAAGPSMATGILFLVLAGIHGRRVVNWRPGVALREPILWILYAGYGWLIVAFLLAAATDLVGVGSRTLVLHALGAGAMAVLMIAVMTRAGLGHTGRPVVAPPLIVVCYVLINMAALARAVVPAFLPGLYGEAMALSALLWIGAFSLFVVVYAPILTGPRADRETAA
jgi:uncharacterized protein involved in response to NO